MFGKLVNWQQVPSQAQVNLCMDSGRVYNCVYRVRWIYGMEGLTLGQQTVSWSAPGEERTPHCHLSGVWWALWHGGQTMSDLARLDQTREQSRMRSREAGDIVPGSASPPEILIMSHPPDIRVPLCPPPSSMRTEIASNPVFPWYHVILSDQKL